MEAINPVVRGLLNGFSLGNMLQQQELAQRRMAMMERQAEFDQQSRTADLTSRLAEIGARNMNPTDEHEMATGTRVVFDEGLPITGGPSIRSEASTLPGRVLAMPGNGQRMVLPTIEDRENRAAAFNQRTLLDRNRADAERMKTEAEIRAQARKQELEATSLPLGGELLRSFGLPEGTRVPAGLLDDLVRAHTQSANIRRPGDPNPGKVAYVVDHVTGNVTPILPMVDAQGMPQLRSGSPAKGIARSRPRQAPTERRGTTEREPKATFTQTVDLMLNKVLEDSAAGGGARMEDAIRNAETYYQDDPRMGKAVRQQVVLRLKKMKAAGNANPYEAAETPAAAAEEAAVTGAPKVGAVEGGYRYNGGDPADQASWTKVR